MHAYKDKGLAVVLRQLRFELRHSNGNLYISRTTFASSALLHFRQLRTILRHPAILHGGMSSHPNMPQGSSEHGPQSACYQHPSQNGWLSEWPPSAFSFCE